MQPLIGLYLDEIGFTGGQIGIITAAGTFTAIFAAPFWGRQYSVLSMKDARDRTGRTSDASAGTGAFVDGAGGTRRYLLTATIFLCTAVVGLLLSQVTVFVGFLLLFVLLYFFQAPSSSLMDSLTIDEGLKFGHIRTFGAMGFAVACFGAAFLADTWGAGMIFPIYAGGFLAAMCTVLLIRRRSRSGAGCPGGNDTKGCDAGSKRVQYNRDESADSREFAVVRERLKEKNESSKKEVDSPAKAEPTAEMELDTKTESVAGAALKSEVKPLAVSGPTNAAHDPMTVRALARRLLSNRLYVLLLACAFFINGPDFANNTYFNFLYLEGGGTVAGVGIAFLLMAGSEAPFMAASDWFCDRFGQGRILLVAMVFSVVRFGLFSLGLPAPLLIALFPLQGLVNGITLVEFVKFTARVVPKELRGIGIAVYYAVSSSISTIVCQLIGGRLLDQGLFSLTGPQSVYIFFAFFNVVGVIIFLAAKLHKQ